MFALANSCTRTYGDLLIVVKRRAKQQRHKQHNRGNNMNVSFIQHVSIRSALTLVFLSGSANAATYSWTEILIPSIGPPQPAFGINDKGQVAVTNAAGTVTGIYSHGIFARLPAPPAGYNSLAAFGINNAGVVTGKALSAACVNCEVGFILTGTTYKFFAQQGFARSTANRHIRAEV